MFLSMVAKYAKLTFEIAKLNLLAAMEYRASFITQVIGMIVNDTCFIALWFIFFQRFPSLNGWGFNDTLLLFGYGTAIFGIVFYFFGGILDMSKSITNGEMDYFLPLPKNVLWHVSVSRNEMSGLGDFLFGITIFFLSGDISLQKTAIFFILLILTSIIFYSYAVILNSITFWVGGFEEASTQLFHTLVGFGLYPQKSFSGALKFMMMTVVPAFFVYTLPVQITKNFDLKILGIIAAFSLFSLLLAVFIFNRGLRRYESGNLMNVRN